MSQSTDVSSALDNCFLEMRHQVLSLAAAFDRVRRADGEESVARDPRMIMLGEAIGILSDAQPDGAKRAQLLFSDPYDSEWQSDS